MSAVEAHFGAPRARHAAVGQAAHHALGLRRLQRLFREYQHVCTRSPPAADPACACASLHVAPPAMLRDPTRRSIRCR